MLVCLRNYIAVVPSFMVGVRVRGADGRLENGSWMWIAKGGDGREMIASFRDVDIRTDDVDRFPVKRCEISLSVSERDSGRPKVTNLVPTNDDPMTTLRRSPPFPARFDSRVLLSLQILL
jgi:hypothetical protein